jgi:hypothetical protein
MPVFARGHGLAPRRRTESAEIAMNPDAPVLLLSNDELVMIFEWLEAGERCTMGDVCHRWLQAVQLCEEWQEREKVRLRCPASKLRGCFFRVRIQLTMVMGRTSQRLVPVELDLTLPLWEHIHTARLEFVEDLFGPSNLEDSCRAGADVLRTEWWVPRPTGLEAPRLGAQCYEARISSASLSQSSPRRSFAFTQRDPWRCIRTATLDFKTLGLRSGEYADEAESSQTPRESYAHMNLMRSDLDYTELGTLFSDDDDNMNPYRVEEQGEVWSPYAGAGIAYDVKRDQFRIHFELGGQGSFFDSVYTWYSYHTWSLTWSLEDAFNRQVDVLDAQWDGVRACLWLLGHRVLLLPSTQERAQARSMQNWLRSGTVSGTFEGCDK